MTTKETMGSKDVVHVKEKSAFVSLLGDWGFWLAMIASLVTGAGTVYFYLVKGPVFAAAAFVGFGSFMALGGWKCLRTPKPPKDKEQPDANDQKPNKK